MRQSTTPPDAWHRSTRSQGANNCVEVVRLTTEVRVRDSKSIPEGMLVFDLPAWSRFIGSVTWPAPGPAIDSA